MTVQRWNIDLAHSGIQFAVRHMVVAKVRGAFEKWQGVIDFDPSQPEASKISVEIDAASIATREPQRDNHLRSADFLHVEKHPVLTFESRKIHSRGKDKFSILGDLTIRGVTRPVGLDVEYLGTSKDPMGNQRIGFVAKAEINRKDFGLNWNQVIEGGGLIVGEQVEITLDVEAVRGQATEKAA